MASAELLVPQHVAQEQRARQLPRPVGYKLLVSIPKAEKTFASGIVKADMTTHAEEVATVVGFVVAMGNEAYKDKTKFIEPWCRVGDFVLMRAYSGTRFYIHDEEFRMLNDDGIEGVVEDPRGIRRV